MRNEPSIHIVRIHDTTGRGPKKSEISRDSGHYMHARSLSLSLIKGKVLFGTSELPPDDEQRVGEDDGHRTPEVGVGQEDLMKRKREHPGMRHRRDANVWCVVSCRGKGVAYGAVELEGQKHASDLVQNLGRVDVQLLPEDSACVRVCVCVCEERRKPKSVGGHHAAQCVPRRRGRGYRRGSWESGSSSVSSCSSNQPRPFEFRNCFAPNADEPAKRWSSPPTRLAN